MTRTPLTWRRLAWKRGSRAKGQPQPYRPLFEGLEDRVVPSYFPSTTNGIHIYFPEYQLNLGGTYQQVKASGGGVLSDSHIDANGNYIGGSLSYQNVSSITLTGGSAAIFLDPTTTSGALTVQTPAQTAANPVTGTSVGLSVLGQENSSDSGLTYTWSSTGPASVTFSANGTNATQNTTATFAQAGTAGCGTVRAKVPRGCLGE